MSINRWLGLLAVAALAAGCSSSPTAVPEAETFGGSATALSVDVTMAPERYVPSHIDIAKGGEVRFVFGPLQHDVRFGGNASAPADILATSDVTVIRTFAATGSFAFLCTLHANMTGTVVVH